MKYTIDVINFCIKKQSEQMCDIWWKIIYIICIYIYDDIIEK